MIEKLRDIYQEPVSPYKENREPDYGVMRKPNIDDVIDKINEIIEVINNMSE